MDSARKKSNLLRGTNPSQLIWGGVKSHRQLDGWTDGRTDMLPPGSINLGLHVAEFFSLSLGKHSNSIQSRPVTLLLLMFTDPLRNFVDSTRKKLNFLLSLVAIPYKYQDLGQIGWPFNQFVSRFGKLFGPYNVPRCCENSGTIFDPYVLLK